MLDKLTLAAAMLIGAFSSASAQAPPWCSSGPLVPSEQMICADAVLGQLDNALNEVYREARRVEPNLEQRTWLAERNECGFSAVCLEAAYRSRIAELRAVASRSDAGFVGRPPRGAISELGRITATPLPDVGKTYDAWEEQDGWEPKPTQREDLSPARDLPPWLRPEEQPDQDKGRRDGLPSLRMMTVLDEMMPRPWCGARRLNSTERTICDDVDLSRLDALLELVYGRATARDEDHAQLHWLRAERDACAADRLCIARAYASRIEALNAPFARAAEATHNIDIPAGYYPPPGMCRVWHLDRPPDQQPPPAACSVPVPSGAILIGG